MKIIAKGTFIHGSTQFKRGSTVEVSQATGKALLDAGLVREATKADEKTAPKAAAAKAPANKAKPAPKADDKE